MSYHLHGRYQRLEESSAPEPVPSETTEAFDFQFPRESIPLTNLSEPPNQTNSIAEHVDDDYEDEKSDGSTKFDPTGWTPFYLRIWVLTCFVILFLLIIATLQVLLSISNARHGIATSTDNLHYLWTYGPTAFLVVVTYFWRQVDYQAKQIQPWSELAKRPVARTNGLLIDYITPFFLESLKDALKKKHFVVVSTITVSLLIKVLTIVSTGLMDLELVKITEQSTQMIVQPTFNATGFTQWAFINYQAPYAVLSNLNYNLSFSPGTTSQYAVQLFRPASGTPQGMTAYTATVDVLRMEVKCEIANATISSRLVEDQWISSNASFAIPDCHLPFKFYDECNITTAGTSYYPWIWVNDCTNRDVNDPSRGRIAFTTYACRPEGVTATGTICSPSYSIRPVSATLDVSGNVLNVVWDSSSQSRQLPGISAMDLVTKAYRRSVQNAEMSLDPNIATLVPLLSPIVDTNMTQLAYLAMNTGPPPQRSTLGDPKYLTSRMTDIIPRLGTQVASIYMLEAGNSTTTTSVIGTADRDQLRLVVRDLPVRLMQSICAIVTLLTLLVMLKTAQDVAPPSILTMGGLATILARSPRIIEMFRGSGTSSMKSLREFVSVRQFSALSSSEENEKTFRVEVTDHTVTTPVWKAPSKIQWDQPFPLRWWSILSTSAACAAVIVTLELMLIQSQRHDGIASVTPESALRYTWLYIPTAILALISIMFGAINFNLEFAHPYHELAFGFTSPNASLFWDPAEHSALRTAWKALRTSRFPLAFSSISVLFAPLLTIVASGLFTVQSMPQYTDLSLNLQDWFELPESRSQSSWMTGSTVTMLVTQSNITYPNGTHDELVFPSIPFTDVGGVGNVSVYLPVLRPRMDCHSISDRDIANMTFVDGTLNGRLSVPTTCGYDSSPDHIDLFDTGFPAVRSGGYFGDMVNFYEWVDLRRDSGCPTPYFVFYGHASGTGLDHFQGYLCSTGVDTLDANVTFDVQSRSVIGKPIVNESSARNFSTWGNQYMPGTLWTNNGDFKVDFQNVYINAAVFGRDGLSPQQLEDPATFLKQLQHVYRQHAAQVINLYRNDSARTNTTALNGVKLDGRHAVYSNADNPRLIQSAISTRILDGILGLLIICGTVILLTFNGTGILPKSMGSLAAVFSLLADSRIVDEANGLTPAGSEWLTHQELRKRGLWKTEEFRMGWWDAKEGDSKEQQQQQDDEQERESLLESASASASVAHNSSISLPLSSGRVSRVFRIDSRPAVQSVGAEVGVP